MFLGKTFAFHLACQCNFFNLMFVNPDLLDGEQPKRIKIT